MATSQRHVTLNCSGGKREVGRGSRRAIDYFRSEDDITILQQNNQNLLTIELHGRVANNPVYIKGGESAL